jgi:hypothetical protein
MISKKSVGLLLVFFSLRIFPGQQQLNSFFHFKKRKNINDVGIINYKKERMHLPSSVWEWHCKRKVFSFFRLGCCCFQALGLGWLVMGDVRKIPSRATGEFRAADMDCVDADEERLHSESTLITSVDSISASTADDPYSPSSNKVELLGRL